MTTRITSTNLTPGAVTTSGLASSISVDRLDSTLFSPRITSLTYNNTLNALVPNVANTLVINGSGFDAGTQVLINEQLCSSVQYISTTQLSVVTPALAIGAYSLLINNSYSQFCMLRAYVVVAAQ
jgi:hypothetical protein